MKEALSEVKTAHSPAFPQGPCTSGLWHLVWGNYGYLQCFAKCVQEKQGNPIPLLEESHLNSCSALWQTSKADISAYQQLSVRGQSISFEACTCLTQFRQIAPSWCCLTQGWSVFLLQLLFHLLNGSEPQLFNVCLGDPQDSRSKNVVTIIKTWDAMCLFHPADIYIKPCG